MEGIITTCHTIRNTITRWQKTGSVQECPRSGPPKKVPESHTQSIDDAMTKNDELTASALKDVLTKKYGEENVQYGIRTEVACDMYHTCKQTHQSFLSYPGGVL